MALRRSMRASQRSTDSGFPAAYDYPGQAANLSHAYSDPELRHSNFDSRAAGELCRDQHDRRADFDDSYDQRRYPNKQPSNHRANPQSRFGNRSRNRDRARERHTVERERNLSRSKPHFGSNEEFEGAGKRCRSMRAVSTGRDINRVYSQTLPSPNNRSSRSNPNTIPKSRAKSVDPRCYEMVDDEVARKTPILCNRYAIDDLARREPPAVARNTRPKKRNSLGGGDPSTVHEAGERRRNHSASPVRTQKQTSDRDLHYQHKYPSSHQQNPNLRYGNQLEIPERQATIGGSRNSGAWNIRGGRKRYSGVDNQMPSRHSNRSPRYDDEPYYDDDDYDDSFEMQPIRKDRRSRRSGKVKF